MTGVTGVREFCRSRSNGRRCTRERGHPGLHRQSMLLWTDVAADPAHCPGSAEHGEPAPALPDGYPGGRALCPRCLGFVALDADGRLASHDTSEADADTRRRAEWFNTFGWE